MPGCISSHCSVCAAGPIAVTCTRCRAWRKPLLPPSQLSVRAPSCSPRLAPQLPLCARTQHGLAACVTSDHPLPALAHFNQPAPSSPAAVLLRHVLHTALCCCPLVRLSHSARLHTVLFTSSTVSMQPTSAATALCPYAIVSHTFSFWWPPLAERLLKSVRPMLPTPCISGVLACPAQVPQALGAAAPAQVWGLLLRGGA
jgi:hypothetical protein